MLLTRKKSLYFSCKSQVLRYCFLKRVFDLVAAFILTIALAPLMLIVAIAIKLDSPGKIVFKQTRVGLNGEQFKVWKFRSMISNGEQLQQKLEAHNEVKGGVIFKMKNDPRITRIGKLLRQYSIDEIPQLFNVLRGDMSLVGPRPLPLRDIARIDSCHNIRHQLLPGITGLAQINGRSQCSSEEYFYWDEFYVRHWTLWLDLTIVLKTILVVIAKRGAY